MVSRVSLLCIVFCLFGCVLAAALCAFTGCASQNVSPSNWQLWLIDPSTAPLRSSYSRVSPVLPTWHPDDGCGLLPHIVWTFHPFVCLQSASGRFRFLVPPFGTTCLSTSHLHRHSRFSDNDPRPFLFSPFCQDIIIIMTHVLVLPFVTTLWTPVADTCGSCNN